MSAANRLRKVIHDLSLDGAASRDEAAALGRLSYYLTNQTAEKLAEAVIGEPAKAGPPKVIQVKVLFWGGEAWQDRDVVRWAGNHPVVIEGDGEWIVTPGGWRAL